MRRLIVSSSRSSVAQRRLFSSPANAKDTESMSMVQAINSAMDVALGSTPHSCLFGEDVSERCFLPFFHFLASQPLSGCHRWRLAASFGRRWDYGKNMGMIVCSTQLCASRESLVLASDWRLWDARPLQRFSLPITFFQPLTRL